MKKVPIITLTSGYLIFGLVMGWTVFGGVYLKSTNAEPLYHFCRIFTPTAFLVSMCLLFLLKSKASHKFVLYAVTPYLTSQLLYLLVKTSLGFHPLGPPLAPFFYPYLFIFVWVLSIFMYLLDYTLTRILFKEKR